MKQAIGIFVGVVTTPHLWLATPLTQAEGSGVHAYNDSFHFPQNLAGGTILCLWPICEQSL
jgi:hypothetical protein